MHEWWLCNIVEESLGNNKVALRVERQCEWETGLNYGDITWWVESKCEGVKWKVRVTYSEIRRIE